MSMQSIKVENLVPKKLQDIKNIDEFLNKLKEYDSKFEAMRIKAEKEFDVNCSVKGGGLSGQAGAIIHGVARALVLFDPELKTTLKKERPLFF